MLLTRAGVMSGVERPIHQRFLSDHVVTKLNKGTRLIVKIKGGFGKFNLPRLNHHIEKCKFEVRQGRVGSANRSVL